MYSCVQWQDVDLLTLHQPNTLGVFPLHPVYPHWYFAEMIPQHAGGHRARANVAWKGILRAVVARFVIVRYYELISFAVATAAGDFPVSPSRVRGSKGRCHDRFTERNIQCGAVGRNARRGHAARLLCEDDGQRSQQGECFLHDGGMILTTTSLNS